MSKKSVAATNVSLPAVQSINEAANSLLPLETGCEFH